MLLLGFFLCSCLIESISDMAGGLLSVLLQCNVRSQWEKARCIQTHRINGRCKHCKVRDCIAVLGLPICLQDTNNIKLLFLYSDLKIDKLSSVSNQVFKSLAWQLWKAVRTWPYKVKSNNNCRLVCITFFSSSFYLVPQVRGCFSVSSNMNVELHQRQGDLFAFSVHSNALFFSVKLRLKNQPPVSVDQVVFLASKGLYQSYLGCCRVLCD